MVYGVTCAQAHANSVWLLRHTLEEQLEQQRASLLVEIEASNVMPMPFPCRHACDPALPVSCSTACCSLVPPSMLCRLMLCPLQLMPSCELGCRGVNTLSSGCSHGLSSQGAGCEACPRRRGLALEAPAGRMRHEAGRSSCSVQRTQRRGRQAARRAKAASARLRRHCPPARAGGGRVRNAPAVGKLARGAASAC